MNLKSYLKNVKRHFLETITKNIEYSVDFAGVMIKRKGGIDFFRNKKFNSSEKIFLRSLGLNGKVIYDIGGHVGVFSIFFSKASGENGSVIVFEPNKDNRNKMERNFKLNGINDIQIIDYGIGDKTEDIELFFRKGVTASGTMVDSIKSSIASEKYYDTQIVKVDSLDNLFKIKTLVKPDFIKMDIEGMEYNALLGMQKIIKKYHPDFYIEIHGADLDDKLNTIKKVYQLLRNLGYSIYHIESNKQLDDQNYTVAKVGHIFCKFKQEIANRKKGFVG